MATNRLLLLASVLLLLPTASAQAELDQDADYPWPADREHVLTWVTVGCDDTLRADADEGAAALNAALAKGRVYLRFHALGHLEAMPELREYADPQLRQAETTGGSYLLTTAIAAKAGADIVVGCVDKEVFAAATENRTAMLIFPTWAATPAEDKDGQASFVRRASVNLMIREQAIPVEGCVDPVPVGHALRQASLQVGLLSGAGLGQRSSEPTDLYGVLEHTNKSCSAWSVPPPRTLSDETRDRLRALWGRDPGPGFAATVAGSMREDPFVWAAVPLALVLGAGGVALAVRLKERKPAANLHGVVRRDERGRPVDAPAMMFRPGDGIAAKDRDPYGPHESQDE